MFLRALLRDFDRALDRDLFNSSLDGNTRRAIDIHEGEKIDARAFKALVKAAEARNGQTAKKRSTLQTNLPQQPSPPGEG